MSTTHVVPARGACLSFAFALAACGTEAGTSSTADDTGAEETGETGDSGGDGDGCGANAFQAAPGEGFRPFRGEWETVVAAPVMTDPSDPAALTELNIGGVQVGDNFANRGDIEVYYTAPPIPDWSGDQIIVQMRKFTFADSPSAALASFDLLEPWLYTAAPQAPGPALEGSECAPADTAGEPTDYFKDQCNVRVYYAGQNQTLRSGVDFRVFVPAAWEGRLNVVTTDNLQEFGDYPDRSDVRIMGLRGSAFIDMESGKAEVRLADDIEPVPACSASMNQECLDAGWNPSEPCAVTCVDFGRVQIRPRGQQALSAVVDAPSSLWTTARLQNTLPGLTADSDPGCPAVVGGASPEGVPADCGEFGECECYDCDPGQPFNRRVGINFPGPDAISGLGYSMDLESGDCRGVDYVDGPGDFRAPRSEVRGGLELCAGCLADVCVPEP